MSIEEILLDFIGATGNALILPDQEKEVEEALKAIEAHITKMVGHEHIDPFDFVEPCEPECSPERHAYHEGQWDLAGRINKFWGLNPHPAEHVDCEQQLNTSKER